MTETQQKEYDSLTIEEKTIYNSVMSAFKSTKHYTAYDVAIQGGVRWNFIFK